MRTVMRKAVGLAMAAAISSSLVLSSASRAEAQTVASGTGKGIFGGALLGGEIGLVTLSAAHARAGWLYAVVPGALAIGGGIGGYFIEKSADPKIPMFMLAGGMALIIPTVVITLSANAYQPGSEDSVPSDAAPADAGTRSNLGVQTNGNGGGASSVTGGSPSVPVNGGGSGDSSTVPVPPPKHKPSPTSMRTPLSRGLVTLALGGPSTNLELGVPVFAVLPMYDRNEMTQFGQIQRYELRAPVVSVAF